MSSGKGRGPVRPRQGRSRACGTAAPKDVRSAWEKIDLTPKIDSLPPPGEHEAEIKDIQLYDKPDVLWLKVHYRLTNEDAEPEPDFAAIAADEHSPYDTEYVRGSHFDDVPDRDNAVVSYQVAVLCPETGERRSAIFQPSGPTRRHRISLSGLLGRAISAALRNGVLGAQARQAIASRTVRVAMAAHFSRADLPGFRDFGRLKRRFDNVRGTFCSIERPAVLDVGLDDGRRVKVILTLFDTKLLAPARAGSLRALGELIGFPKLRVPEVVDEQGKMVPGLERMDLVREQHPQPK